jgi:hypothetical protein
MEKNIKDYLHLYLGCECLFNTGVVVRRTLFPEMLIQINKGFASVELLLRKLDSMNEDEAIECIKEFDDGLGDDPQFKILGKEDGDWIYVQVGYEETECCWEPKPKWMSAKLVHYLLSKGFDLFNLIDSGLAIEKQS